MTKEKIIIQALSLSEYERKQVAMVLLGSMLTPAASDEAISMIKTNNLTVEISFNDHANIKNPTAQGLTSD